ncbi:transglutaminase family protein [Roseovarius faecimaris]|uniref:Transglutaminase family protein n=1 Tax=Roseovarius faecimaris TaxID=2494550 RepID=A0A6I6IQV5_9RHOB|nr:transglutaminase family protein [Roseovarius faecimaris]QGX99075.1 transglutaminase family protein [Roseovarius faecimaris]
MRLTIRHETRYHFAAPVKYGLQQLRKTPKSSHKQKVLSWRTLVDGGRRELTYEDHHNNSVELIGFERDVQELLVVSEGEVELNGDDGIVGAHQGKAPLWLFLNATRRTEARQGIKAFLRGLPDLEPLAQLHALSDRIRETVSYKLGASDPDWTAEEALAAGKGVCQDHTHVFLSCARELGYPARYVSGYLMLNDRTVQDAMHAWAEAHVEGLGWVGFDVSNGISPDTRYVRVATGLDYGEAAPVSGTRIGGDKETLSVSIDVAQQ